VKISAYFWVILAKGAVCSYDRCEAIGALVDCWHGDPLFDVKHCFQLLISHTTCPLLIVPLHDCSLSVLY